MNAKDLLATEGKTAETCTRAACQLTISASQLLNITREQYKSVGELLEETLTACRKAFEGCETSQDKDTIVWCGEEMSMQLQKNRLIISGINQLLLLIDHVPGTGNAPGPVEVLNENNQPIKLLEQSKQEPKEEKPN